MSTWDPAKNSPAVENGSGYVIEFECGVDPVRLRAWFSEADTAGVSVTLSPCEARKLGCVSLPRTLVRMEGTEHAVRQLYDRFYLQFMSAGG